MRTLTRNLLGSLAVAFVMAVALAATCSAALAQDRIAAWSGPGETPGRTVLLACNADVERCSFVHVQNIGQPTEEWVMGAGPIEYLTSPDPDGVLFCITADTGAVGDINGATGQAPFLLNSRACFLYLDHTVRVEGTEILLTPDYDLADRVGAEVADQDSPEGWGRS
jgi:hypothetical protein